MQFFRLNKKNSLLAFFFSLTALFGSFFSSSTVKAANSEIDAFAHLSPEVKKQIEAQVKKMQEDLLEENLKQILELFEKFDFNCEYLAQVINNNQLTKWKIDTKQAISCIKSLRQLVNEIKKGSYIHLDPYHIKILLHILQHLIGYMKTAIKKQLQEFPEIKLDAVITRAAQDQEFDPEQIKALIETTKKDLASLNKETEIIGLSLFNRGYRAVEKFWSDHHVNSKLAFTALASLGIYTLYSRWTIENDQINQADHDAAVLEAERAVTIAPEGIDDAAKKKIAETAYLNARNTLHNARIAAEAEALLKENDGSWSYLAKSKARSLFSWLGGSVFGKKIDRNQVTNEIVSKTQPGLLSKAEDYLSRLHIIDLGFPTLLTWQVIGGYFSTQWKDFKIFIQKSWESFRSFLRGGPAENKIESWKKEPKARFVDIIGKEHHKNTLSLLIDYIRNSERYERAGIRPEIGYLLAGPSRTGKTYLAEALAGELKDALVDKGLVKKDEFNFLSFNGADIMHMNMNGIMAYAESHAPCVIFVDELDMARLQREANSSALADMLTALSGYAHKSSYTKPVIVIAATNKPENLDQALLQKGRFGKILWFDYPSFEDRLSFFKRELDNRGVISIEEEYLTKIAQETEGCSFDDLKAIIVTALQRSKATGKILTAETLERAFDEEIRHIIFDEIQMPEDQKKIMAVHQTGHALVRILLDENHRINKMTIRPIDIKIEEEGVWAKYDNDGKAKNNSVTNRKQYEYGRVFAAKAGNAAHMQTYREVVREIQVSLAGRIAEEIILGSASCNYHKDDVQNAYKLAKSLIFEGMNESELPKEIQEQRTREAYQLVEKCKHETRAILEQFKPQIIAISDALCKKLILSSAEILEILRSFELKQEPQISAIPALPNMENLILKEAAA